MLDFKPINYNESAESEPEPYSSTGLSVVAAVNDTLERSPTNILSQHINKIAQDYLHSYTNNQDEMPENVKGEFKNGAPKYIIDASSEIAEQKKVNEFILGNMPDSLMSKSAVTVAQLATSLLDPIGIAAGGLTMKAISSTGALNAIKTGLGESLLAKAVSGSAEGAAGFGAFSAPYEIADYQYDKDLGEDVSPMQILTGIGKSALFGGAIGGIFPLAKPMLDAIGDLATQAINKGKRFDGDLLYRAGMKKAAEEQGIDRLNIDERVDNSGKYRYKRAVEANKQLITRINETEVYQPFKENFHIDKDLRYFDELGNLIYEGGNPHPDLMSSGEVFEFFKRLTAEDITNQDFINERNRINAPDNDVSMPRDEDILKVSDYDDTNRIENEKSNVNDNLDVGNDNNNSAKNNVYDNSVSGGSDVNGSGIFDSAIQRAESSVKDRVEKGKLEAEELDSIKSEHADNLEKADSLGKAIDDAFNCLTGEDF